VTAAVTPVLDAAAEATGRSPVPDPDEPAGNPRQRDSRPWAYEEPTKNRRRADKEETTVLRAAPTTTRAPLETTQLCASSRPRRSRPARESSPASAASPAARARPARDWSGVWQGIREVFLTVAATLALGLAWAAIEGERLEAAEAAGTVAAVEVARLETGYAATRATGR
jgi:hypothetical protein